MASYKLTLDDQLAILNWAVDVAYFGEEEWILAGRLLAVPSDTLIELPADGTYRDGLEVMDMDLGELILILDDLVSGPIQLPNDDS